MLISMLDHSNRVIPMHKKALNFELFERHLIPRNKLLLMGASCSYKDKPKIFSARFALDISLQFPLQHIQFKRYVDIKSKVLSAYQHTVHWMCLDITMTRQDDLPGSSDKGRNRYQSFMTAMLEDGYEVEWQYLPPGYRTRAEFERALLPSVNQELPAVVSSVS